MTDIVVEHIASAIADRIPLSSGRYLAWDKRHEEEREPYRQVVREALSGVPMQNGGNALSRAYRMGGDSRAMTIAAWLRTLVDWNISLERAAEMIGTYPLGTCIKLVSGEISSASLATSFRGRREVAGR